MVATLTKQQVDVRAELTALVAELKDPTPGLVLTYRWLNNRTVYLDVIALPGDARNRGIGSEVMQALVEYADQHHVRIMLVPDSCFGSDLNRLRRFYERFGFHRDGSRRNYLYTPAA